MNNQSLTERAMERDERIRDPITAESEFNVDPEAVMAKLAAKAYPDNAAEQKRYAEKIKASLQEHLKVSVEELWKFLEKNNCKTTAIIEGILRFYAGPKGKLEIGIGRFLKSAVFPAESNLDKTFNEAREEKKKTTKENLMSLLTELRMANPDLPQLPN